MNNQEQLDQAKNKLLELTLEYKRICMENPAGSRKELLEDLLRRVRQAKKEYGLQP